MTLDGFAAGRDGEIDFIAESTGSDAVASEVARDQLRFLDGIGTAGIVSLDLRPRRTSRGYDPRY